MSTSKQSIICDIPKQSDQGPAYELKSTLKTRRLTFGDPIENTRFIYRAEKAKEHVPPADTYKPQFNRTELQRFRDIKLDRGPERMKPKVICSNILRHSTPTAANPVMADSLLA